MVPPPGPAVLQAADSRQATVAQLVAVLRQQVALLEKGLRAAKVRTPQAACCSLFLRWSAFQTQARMHSHAALPQRHN